MTIKFFPRDVIGKQPKKAGDKFKALFMGTVCLFEVTEISNGCIFAIVA